MVCIRPLSWMIALWDLLLYACFCGTQKKKRFSIYSFCYLSIAQYLFSFCCSFFLFSVLFDTKKKTDYSRKNRRREKISMRFNIQNSSNTHSRERWNIYENKALEIYGWTQVDWAKTLKQDVPRYTNCNNKNMRLNNETKKKKRWGNKNIAYSTRHITITLNWTSAKKMVSRKNNEFQCFRNEKKNNRMNMNFETVCVGHGVFFLSLTSLCVMLFWSVRVASALCILDIRIHLIFVCVFSLLFLPILRPYSWLVLWLLSYARSLSSLRHAVCYSGVRFQLLERCNSHKG